MTCAPSQIDPELQNLVDRGFCRRYFCTDWSQPVEAFGCLAGTAAAGVGCYLMNIPVIVTSSLAAAVNAFAVVRMSSLGNVLLFGQKANQLGRSVRELRSAEMHKDVELQEMRTSVQLMSKSYDHAKEEWEKSFKERESYLKQITELTQKIDQTEQRYHKVREALETLQKSLGIRADSVADIAESLSSEDAKLSQTVGLLVESVQELKIAESAAADENARLQQTLNEMKKEGHEQRKALRKQLKELRDEKEAIQKLVAAQASVEELEEKASLAAEKLQKIQQQIEDLAPELAKILHLSPRLRDSLVDDSSCARLGSPSVSSGADRLLSPPSEQGSSLGSPPKNGVAPPTVVMETSLSTTNPRRQEPKMPYHKS